MWIVSVSEFAYLLCFPFRRHRGRSGLRLGGDSSSVGCMCCCLWAWFGLWFSFGLASSRCWFCELMIAVLSLICFTVIFRWLDGALQARVYSLEVWWCSG